MIFSYFRVPPAFQHRTLFWGILGALVMRGAMIAAGAALIARFEWVIYVFGALLVATAVKLLITRDDTVEPDRNPLVRLARKLYPVSPQFEGQRFFTQINGRRAVTPLFLVLLVVESTDVLFAVDSIPAIFAITQDPFLVFTSNVFAILNLRSLYFALAAVIGKFRYLKLSLVFVLAFVGVKMLLSHHYGIPTLLSLGVIAGILIAGVLASIYGNRPSDPPYSAPVAAELSQLAGNTWRHSRRIVILVVGVTVVLIGIAATMIPGIPAIVVVPVGLAILGTEFVWAKRLLGAMKRKVQDLKRSLAPGSRAIEPPGGPAAGVDASREPVRVPEPFAEPESSTP